MKTNNLKKRNYLIMAGIISAIFAIIISCSFKSNEETRVIFVTGNAEIRHNQGNAEPMNIKMLLKKGDIIKTGSGFVLIQIGDNIMVRIQSNTTVEVAKLFDQAETRLSLSNGQLISAVKKLSKNSNFRIQTPTALASVRGTQYSISYYKSRSVLAVREGKVQIDTIENKKEKQNIVSSGSTMVISKGKGRNINVFESLEIEKISEMPYNSSAALNNDDAYKTISQKAKEKEQKIDKTIADNGGPIPRTSEEMLKKYGYLNKVILYSNKYYVGIVKSRGATVKIMTLDGIETVPFKNIRNIKRTGYIIEN